MPRLIGFTRSGEVSAVVQFICGSLGWAYDNGSGEPEKWVREPSVDAALFDLQHPVDDAEGLAKRMANASPFMPLIFLSEDMKKLQELDEGINYCLDAHHIDDLEHILISLTFGFGSGFTFPDEGKKNLVPRVLIVDDNAQLAGAIEHALRAAQPFDVHVTSSGFEAASILLEFHPDVAIIDLVLSDMNGREVCAFIRSHEQLKNVKIIGVSGYLSEDHVGGPRDHFDAFLEKPFRLKDIVDKVRSLVQR